MLNSSGTFELNAGLSQIINFPFTSDQDPTRLDSSSPLLVGINSRTVWQDFYVHTECLGNFLEFAWGKRNRRREHFPPSRISSVTQKSTSLRGEIAHLRDISTEIVLICVDRSAGSRHYFHVKRQNVNVPPRDGGILGEMTREKKVSRIWELQNAR